MSKFIEWCASETNRVLLLDEIDTVLQQEGGFDDRDVQNLITALLTAWNDDYSTDKSNHFYLVLTTNNKNVIESIGT